MVQKIGLILLGSCPDLLLLNQCLLRLLQCHLAVRGAHGPMVFHRLLPLEAPLCQLLVSHGLTCTQVRAWRDAAGMGSPEAQLAAGCRVLQRASAAGADVSAAREALTMLLGSFVLFSLEQRARLPPAVRHQASAADLYARDVLPALQQLQTHSYHVQAFLASGSAAAPGRDRVSPALQVIWPSQQVFVGAHGRFVKPMTEVLPRHRHPHQRDVHHARDNPDENRTEARHLLRRAFHPPKPDLNTEKGIEDPLYSFLLEDEEDAIARFFGPSA
ncbi:hypothetical protein STCU_12048 [Strigomonas culicis]|uniref:Uncharacterized protein n=1 Tax=Strigomonas culicis TaxID=28005 RepID=S9TGB8_9TRYP|nr:hypothetical protein STCU_12048 [Strigomonas culicis]|eukprot:EPY15403.1 hypothetical protein STCU_12048 [Strigomonas culicis]